MILIIMITMISMVLISCHYIKDKLPSVIISVYITWWMIWLSLSTFNVYSLYPVSNSTYLLLIVNVIVFSIGFLISGKFNRKEHTLDANNYINDKLLEEKTFLKFIIIIVCILLYYWIRYRNALHIMGAYSARLERYKVGIIFTSIPELLFYNFFIEAFMLAAPIIVAYMVVNKKVKNLTFVLILASIFLFAGIGSGRTILMNVIISIIVVFLIKSIKNIEIKKVINITWLIKRIKLSNFIFISLIIITLFFYASWITAQRMGYNQFNLGAIQIGVKAFIEQAITYYTIPFRLLDYGIKNYSDKIGYMFGRGTFAGIDEILNYGLRILGIRIASSNRLLSEVLQNNQVEVGVNLVRNYSYTCVMIYYLDFRILGVILFSSMYGFFVRKAIFVYERKKTILTLIMVVFLVNSTLYSVFSWGLQSPSSNILIIAIYLLYRHHNIKLNSVFKFRKINNN